MNQTEPSAGGTGQDRVHRDPSRALAALDAMTSIGDEAERESTLAELMKALAASRRAEGRLF